MIKQVCLCGQSFAGKTTAANTIQGKELSIALLTKDSLEDRYPVVYASLRETTHGGGDAFESALAFSVFFQLYALLGDDELRTHDLTIQERSLPDHVVANVVGIQRGSITKEIIEEHISIIGDIDAYIGSLIEKWHLTDLSDVWEVKEMKLFLKKTIHGFLSILGNGYDKVTTQETLQSLHMDTVLLESMFTLVTEASSSYGHIQCDNVLYVCLHGGKELFARVNQRAPEEITSYDCFHLSKDHDGPIIDHLYDIEAEFYLYVLGLYRRDQQVLTIDTTKIENNEEAVVAAIMEQIILN